MTGCAPAGGTTASGPPVRARTTTCRSPTVSSSPWSTCGSSSRMPRWQSCTGWTGPRSAARSGRSARCSPPAGSPCPTSPACGCGPWPTCSPTPPPKALNCGSTAPKCRSGVRPRGKPGRRAFVSGKKKQNTKKATVITGPRGNTLWAGAFRPGRMHDQTAVRTEGIADLFTQFPQVKAKVDAGYRGLAKEFPDQVQAPPLKPKKDAPPGETAVYETERHRQSSERICVEHANAEHKQWRTLQRYLGRREDFDETFLAVAGLVSDRAAER